MAAHAPNEATRIRAAASRAEGLHLLVLFGSRARAEARPSSDWDFGYLGDGRFDPMDFLPALVDAVGNDRIDLVNLGRAGALLRFRAARDGIELFELQPSSFESFQLEAISFWCDAEPVLRRAYERSLRELTK